MKTVELNGNDFDNLTEFFESIGELLVDGNNWGKNWNALNDILYGGFIKTEYEEEFDLIWVNSERSKLKLKDFEDIVNLIRQHPHINLQLK